MKLVRPGGGQRRLDPPHGPQAPGRGARPASIWFVLFDAAAAGPRATKRQFGGRRARRRPAPTSGSTDATLDRRPRDAAASRHRRPRGELGPQLRRRRRALPPPAARLPLPAPLPKTKFLAPYPDARFNGRLEVDGERIELDGLARDDRPQLGRRARRALGLAPGHRLRRPLAGGLLRRRSAGSRSAGRTTPWVANAMLMLDGEGATGSAASATIREHRGRRAADRLRASTSPARTSGPRPGLRRRQGLRRLGLRRPGGARAQHAQLLGLRPRADRRTPAARPRALTRRGAAAYEFGHARDRPRHPDPALPRRLKPSRAALLLLLEEHPGVGSAERDLRAASP